MRVNLLRLAAVLLFYGRHLASILLGKSQDERGHYHLQVTLIAVAWAASVILVHWTLSRRHVPYWLKYATTAADAILITLLCAISGGPRSAMLVLYFPLIASAPLRLSLHLVWTTTAQALAGYLFVLGHYIWRIGFHQYYSTPELRVPRRHEAIFLLALLVCGLFAGQSVRQMKRLVLRPVISQTLSGPV
jgi:hypothetical protein